MPRVTQLKAKQDGAWWLPDGYVRITVRRMELHRFRQLSTRADRLKAADKAEA